MAISISYLESRLQEYEVAIKNSLENHSGLLAAFRELNNLLSIAKEVVPVVDPSLTPVVDTVSNVAEAVSNALDTTPTDSTVDSGS